VDEELLLMEALLSPTLTLEEAQREVRSRLRRAELPRGPSHLLPEGDGKAAEDTPEAFF